MARAKDFCIEMQASDLYKQLGNRDSHEAGEPIASQLIEQIEEFAIDNLSKITGIPLDEGLTPLNKISMFFLKPGVRKSADDFMKALDRQLSNNLMQLNGYYQIFNRYSND